MSKQDFCYLVIYEQPEEVDILMHLSRVDSVFRNPNSAIERVKEYSEIITEDYYGKSDTFKILYNCVYNEWPWLFMYEVDGMRIAYKVVPIRYED